MFHVFDPGHGEILENAFAAELINEGVDFDVIAIEYHYRTLQSSNADHLRQAIVDLASLGKKYSSGRSFARAAPMPITKTTRTVNIRRKKAIPRHGRPSSSAKR